MAGSARSAVTSFTISAPSSSARRATSALAVSIDTGTSPWSRSKTGTTRRSSSSRVTPLEPGRVDSPPTSTIAAPSRTIRRAVAAAASGSRLTPPSENESGVTLTTPMTDGRGKRSSIGGRTTFRRIPALAGGGFGRRRLQRSPGRGERPRRRLREALSVRLRLRLGLRGLRLLDEHVLLGLAREQPLELLLVDRLALDEDRGDSVQVVHVLLEHLPRRVVPVLDHAPDLVVDLARDLLRVVGLVAHLAAEERHVAVVAEHARAELLAHAVAHDHLLRGRRDLLEVVGRAGRDLVEDELLRRAAAERHREVVHQRAAGRQVAVLARQRDRVAERLAAADDRDLVHRVGVLEVVGDEGVAHLVVGGDLPLLLGEEPGLLLRAGDHAHDPFLELLLLDRLLAAAGREERRLVDEVREIRAGEAGRAGGERVEVDLRRERLALRVHLEDLPAAVPVGPVDDDLAVEAARPQERRVEDVGAVRGRDQDDVVLQLEPVHLDEELVQRLLALVVAAAEAGASLSA